MQQEKKPKKAQNSHLNASQTAEATCINKNRGLDLKGVLNNNIREKILKAFLDTAILARLEDKAMSGYELTTVFMKKFGTVTSTSTVYATLYAMERNGLIEGSYSKRSRVYKLTEKGKETLEYARNTVEDTQAFIKTLLR